jgi:O-succinylbenzoic acid--CoA ligase
VSFLRPSGDLDGIVGALRAWLEGDGEQRLLVETSGSSGTPKRVVLPRSAVLASVAASAARVGATGPWVLALPAAYVAGLQVLVRSLVAGHEPTLLERDGWPAGEGWFTSLVPTQLARMLRSPEDAAALGRAHTVLLGGGPIDPSLRAAAEQAGVRVVATYGAAETAGGCVYDGLPLDGVAVALGEGGRIRIAGPTLFEGYDGAPELTAETLVDGWYLTSDAGRIDEDGRLSVIGRIDDVIVSGGVNVPGPAVAARLREHPGVEAAEVLGVPDEEWGNRVVAFVATRRRPSLDDVRDWVAGALPRAWAPRQLVVLPELPLLPNGKPDRVTLRGLA